MRYKQNIEINPSNETCPYCGRSMITAWASNVPTNNAHIIPLALIKWTDIEDPNLLYELSYPNVNIYRACVSCNTDAGAYIPTVDEIKEMCLSTYSKSKILELYDKCKPFIDKYNDMIKRKYAEQNGECMECKKMTSIKKMSPRRKDKSKDKVYENMQLLCNSCQDWYSIKQIQRI